MKTQIFKTILISFTVLVMSSCSAIFTGMYGMKKTKTVDEKLIYKYAQKYDMDQADCFELDTNYLDFLFSLDTAKYKEEIKNHYQPLQALYYDNQGFLKSFQVNCYAGGFPNLKWNRNEIMSTFPPKIQAPIDSILSLQTHLNFIKPLSQSAQIYSDSFDYIVVVYWSRFMGRQSERLVRFVQENRMLCLEKKVKIIYVNTDNVFAKNDY